MGADHPGQNYLVYSFYWLNIFGTFPLQINKLDRVGPIDNRPSTDKFHHFVQKKKCDMGHMTRDMWHVTCDTWHVTSDMWYVWGDEHSSKFQLPSSYCLWFMILWRSGGKGSLSDWMSKEAVYRPAPATLGLLIINVKIDIHTEMSFYLNGFFNAFLA